MGYAAFFPVQFGGRSFHSHFANFQLRAQRQDLKAAHQALHNGDAGQAQEALGRLAEHVSGAKLEKVAEATEAITTALQSGDTEAAHDEFASLIKTLRRYARIHHGHHRHHPTTEGTQTTEGTTPAEEPTPPAAATGGETTTETETEPAEKPYYSYREQKHDLRVLARALRSGDAEKIQAALNTLTEKASGRKLAAIERAADRINEAVEEGSGRDVRRSFFQLARSLRHIHRHERFERLHELFHQHRAEEAAEGTETTEGTAPVEETTETAETTETPEATQPEETAPVENTTETEETAEGGATEETGETEETGGETPAAGNTSIIQYNITYNYTVYNTVINQYISNSGEVTSSESSTTRIDVAA
jgi:hypothetical protein